MKVVSGKKVCITELISAIIALLTGVFLMLAGLKVFPFSIGECWLMAVYVCFFWVSLVAAVIQKNSIAGCFTVILAVLIVAQIFVLSGCTHRQIYPFYIIALPMGIAGGWSNTHYAARVISVCLAVTIAGLLLFLESTSLLPIAVVLPLIAVYLSVIGIVYAAVRLRTKNNLHNKENE